VPPAIAGTLGQTCCQGSAGQVGALVGGAPEGGVREGPRYCWREVEQIAPVPTSQARYWQAGRPGPHQVEQGARSADADGQVEQLAPTTSSWSGQGANLGLSREVPPAIASRAPIRRQPA
jgi:hypothetical protein